MPPYQLPLCLWFPSQISHRSLAVLGVLIAPRPRPLIELPSGTPFKPDPYGLKQGRGERVRGLSRRCGALPDDHM